MCRIERIQAREVFDSRGKPTVEVDVTCGENTVGRAIVPSGASTGRFEAVELRDGDNARFDGQGVLRAVSHVNDEIAAALRGKNADDQQAVDRLLCELDGTENKSRLGANAILGVSMACASAAATSKRISLMRHLQEVWQRVRGGDQSASATLAGLGAKEKTARAAVPRIPLPMVNMISGGLHADGNLAIQDVLILPLGANSLRQAFEWIVTVYRRLGTLLREAGQEGYLVGDEGGYGPRLSSNAAALEFVVAAIESAGLKPGQDVALGLDVAATHFYADEKYRLSSTGDQRLSAVEMIDVLESWVDQYFVISIEDGLAEDDWSGWERLTKRLGARVQLIGDDLFVTNQKRLQQGIDRGVGNSILIKLNQIGTVWETLETLRLALENGYRPVVSARSGESEDTFIADLVVATAVGQLKVGSVARSERLAKYNQLLRLDEELGDGADFIGGEMFRGLSGF
ncbi:MAG: phosphopyruvate hydratase [Planctomycetes bacterium]|nr:phosphopyruvate hydratase [Planctomycetota bacterium]